MKRLSLCLLAVFTLFLLSSCNGNITSSPLEPIATADTSTGNTETVSPSAYSQAMSPDSETEQVSQANNTDNNDNIKLKITIGDTALTATMEVNSSAEALLELLTEKPLTINMRDYGSMEKVGSLGTSLPRNDKQISTEPGDLILFQGNSFVVYYAPNSWNFTRLGKINNITKNELMDILGSGDVTVTLSL